MRLIIKLFIRRNSRGIQASSREGFWIDFDRNCFSFFSQLNDNQNKTYEKKKDFADEKFNNSIVYSPRLLQQNGYCVNFYRIDVDSKLFLSLSVIIEH